MNDYRYRALIILGITTVLFFISYPFKETFWGGLAASSFSAAMIGGLADWFAVAALFRRPLMIPFRTAVIPNNRERIFAAIINMVEKELLTSQNIKQALSDAGLAQEIIDQIRRPEAEKRLKNLALSAARQWLENLTPDKAGQFLAGIFREHLNNVKLAPLIGQALAWSVRKGYIDQALNLLFDECRQLADKDYLKNILISIYNNTQQTYVGDMFRRKLVRIVMEEFLKLTPEKIAELAQEKLSSYLADMRDNPDKHNGRRKIKAFLVKLSSDLKQNPEYSEKIENWKQDFLSRPYLAAFFARLFTQLTEILNTNQNRELTNPDLLEDFLTEAGREFQAALTDNPSLKTKFDVILITQLSGWINSRHSQIGAMVSEYLAGWSNEKLVDYIESKVGNDLQMIRINGSVVGGLTGLVLYLITFLIEAHI